MNEYGVLQRIIQIILFVLLVAMPFGYCVIRGHFKKGFWFTWIVWSVVIFVFGMLLPALGALREKVTGQQPDMMCGGFVLGILTGWLPGLVFSFVGKFLHNIFMKSFLKNN